MPSAEHISPCESESDPTGNGRGRIALGGGDDRGAAQEGSPANWETRVVPGQEAEGGPAQNLQRGARPRGPARAEKNKSPNPESWSDEDCERLLKAKELSWQKAQKLFKDDAKAKQRLVNFRKSFVDKLISELAAGPVS